MYMSSYTPCDPATRVVMPYILPARSMGLHNRHCVYIIYIYIDIYIYIYIYITGYFLNCPIIFEGLPKHS